MSKMKELAMIYNQAEKVLAEAKEHSRQSFTDEELEMLDVIDRFLYIHRMEFAAFFKEVVDAEVVHNMSRASNDKDR
jgi:hypothetical protein